MAGRIWLGAPNSIKGPTEAIFQRQSGNNLLFVGQREEAILAILSVGLIPLAAQYRRGRPLHLCDASRPGPPSANTRTDHTFHSAPDHSGQAG